MVSSSWIEAGLRAGPAPFVSREDGRSVVWLAGEQDLATVEALVATLTNVAALDDADLVVDLSQVSFIDASTMGALIRGRRDLRGRSRNLTVRDPSRFARRVLEMCGIADLVDPPEVALRRQAQARRTAGSH